MRPLVAIAALAAALALSPGARAQVASPHAIDIPKWFTESFLDMREDVREAAREGKRLMLYFGQDGCPYCKALMKVNFGDPEIAAQTRRHFVAVALNIWGDREVKWMDGRVMPEKELARVLKVQYTPTLLFFDEKGAVALRLNGYQPPERFRVALDYARLPSAGRPAYADYLAKRLGTAPPQADEGVQGLLGKGKPVLVIVSRPGCRECEDLERERLRQPEVASLLERFVVARRDAAGTWARGQGVAEAPTLVFLDAAGKEAFRAEGYLRPFHLVSAMEYVASGAYRTQPNFQRYVQARADRLRAEGRRVELWD
jgi:thioredoxin-related protein